MVALIMGKVKGFTKAAITILLKKGCECMLQISWQFKGFLQHFSQSHKCQRHGGTRGKVRE